MGKLRKADYIAKYGEEAWNAKAEKRREYMKQWRQDNKESVAEYNKQYYDTKKEYFLEHNKQYYSANKEYLAERNKQWRQGNKNHIAEYNKQYREANRDRIDEYNKQYSKTQRGRANNTKLNYIKKDKEKGFSTDKNVDEDWIIKHIFNSVCIYCGESDWTKLGCDRIDNTKGHTPDNCVCACESCNKERKDKFTVEEFVQYRKLHPREQPIPDADDKVINAWKGRFKVSSKSIRV